LELIPQTLGENDSQVMPLIQKAEIRLLTALPSSPHHFTIADDPLHCVKQVGSLGYFLASLSLYAIARFDMWL
jgi:hypothetical protein